jgi:hypothetical protein
VTTSGTTTFSVSRDDLIRDAFDYCGLLDPTQTMPAAHFSSAAIKLNMMIKAWMAQGLHMWGISEATLFQQKTVQRYGVSSTGWHCTNSYVKTTLAANAATSATTITLASTSGISNGDHIAVMLDSGSLFWTTVTTIGTTLIASGLTSAASSGAVVFAYTTKINRPQRIISAYRRNISGADIVLDMLARGDYAELARKNATGKPVQFYYDKQLTTGYINIWPTTDDESDVIRFFYERIIEDAGIGTDNIEYPIEWAEAISSNLALRIAPGFGVPLDVQANIRGLAGAALDLAKGYDREDGPVSFMPDLSRH